MARYYSARSKLHVAHTRAFAAAERGSGLNSRQRDSASLVYSNESTKPWRWLGVGATAQWWSSVIFGGYMVLVPTATLPLLERGALAGTFVAFSAAVLFGVSKLSGKLITRIETERNANLVTLTTLGVMVQKQHTVRAEQIQGLTQPGQIPVQPVKIGSDVFFFDTHNGTVHDVGRLRQLFKSN